MCLSTLLVVSARCAWAVHAAAHPHPSLCMLCCLVSEVHNHTNVVAHVLVAVHGCLHHGLTAGSRLKRVRLAREHSGENGVEVALEEQVRVDYLVFPNCAEQVAQKRVNLVERQRVYRGAVAFLRRKYEHAFAQLGS